jgi:hypothetical protein
MVRVSSEKEAIMSPIFNHHALRGLSTSALEQLRSVVLQSLGSDRLSEAERINLHAALASIEAVLRTRAAQPVPRIPAPSL